MTVFVASNLVSGLEIAIRDEAYAILGIMCAYIRFLASTVPMNDARLRLNLVKYALQSNDTAYTDSSGCNFHVGIPGRMQVMSMTHVTCHTGSKPSNFERDSSGIFSFRKKSC